MADLNLIARLADLLTMSHAEIRSRQNAWAEVQEAGRALIADIDADDMAATIADTSDRRATRAILDAQLTGQARPVVRTIHIANPKEAAVIATMSDDQFNSLDQSGLAEYMKGRADG